MLRHSHRIRALIASALFVCTAALAANSATVHVDRVVDGDTLRLNDDQLLRFIGINTPELDHRGDASEAVAEEARDYLVDMLKQQGNRVGLETGEEAEDRHERLLAYPTLPDGRDITALMLKQGLGWAITIGANDLYHECYYAAEAHARQQQLGVWAHYPIIDAKELDKNARGFHLLRGKVLRLRQFRRELYIDISGTISLRIPRNAQSAFEGFDWPALYDKIIEVRGWVSKPRGRLVINVSHPAVIRNTETPINADLSACGSRI